MLYSVFRRLLFKMDAEAAHDFSIKMLRKTGATPFNAFYQQTVPNKPVKVMGIEFPNPVGLSAGLDKNAECIDAFAAMGFGFIGFNELLALFILVFEH